MPSVALTPNLPRHLHVEGGHYSGKTVAEVLAAMFVQHPTLRGYLLEDSGAVRRHVAIFIGSATIKDRVHLTDPIAEDETITIMQSLSGG